jgi:TatD DNase family protein
MRKIDTTRLALPRQALVESIYMSTRRLAPPALEGWIDTHFHILQSLNKGLTPPEVLGAAFDSGMAWGIDIATDLDSLEQRLAFAGEYPGLYFSVGAYPSLAETELPGTLDDELFAQAGSHPSIIAVGEIGLDYHWNFGTPERQRELFTRQLRVANRAGLPVVIHCREAEDDLIQVLKDTPPAHGGVLHCFAGEYAFAAGCLDAGLSISFAGNVTYKKADKLRDVLKRIPLSSLLLETDAPYLSPEPWRGKLNSPERIRYTYGAAADLLGIAAEELCLQVAATGQRVFNLPE